MRFSLAALAAMALLVMAPSADAAGKLPRVPPGFTIEVAAGSPLVKYPMMAGFDDDGRLYIAESAGKNIRSADLLKDPPNFIRRLEDTDGDGRFDKSTIFADKMTLPMGALWHRGSLYVASPPSIWRLRDTNDDGVADERVELVNTFGFSGNAASVHGCFLGPNGRLYWCDGRHGHEFRDRDGKVTSKGKAARIFSCRLDGSDVECWSGGGMDNPVEVDFLPNGEMVGSVNIFLGRPRADTLVHWLDGGAYPRFDQACTAEFIKTGTLLPAMTDLGHVAVSGMTRYRSDQFGAGYRNNIFTTLFNTHRVVRSVVVRSGATFRTTESDFLVSDNADFHPTDVFEDADGSLLVIDTGGWFRIGCPVSKVAKPDIHGAIYRVRRKGSHQVKDPRGSFLKFADFSLSRLTGYLDDPRPAVRRRVTDQLAVSGNAAVPALAAVTAAAAGRPAASIEARRNAIWSLSRIGSEPARVALRAALADRSPGVRIAAARSLGMLADGNAASPLVKLLADETDAAVRRQAAAALGRISVGVRSGRTDGRRRRQAVTGLLAALRRDGVDRFEEHALLYAAIRLNDRAGMLPLLADRHPRVRRGALIVLDQMTDGKLTRELVVPLLDTDDPELQQQVLAVIGRHEGWAGETRRLLEEWLAAETISAERQVTIRGFLLAQQRDAGIQSLVDARLVSTKTSPVARALLLDVVGRSTVEPLPPTWLMRLAEALGHPDEAVRRRAVGVLAGRRLVVPGVEALADDAGQPAGIRVAALTALAGRTLSSSRFEFLGGRLQADVLPLDRLAAARVISDAKLDRRQLLALARRLPSTGPLELPAVLRAFAANDDADVGRAMLAGLERSAVIESVAGDQLAALLKRLPGKLRARSRVLLARVGDDLEQQRQALDKIESLASGGDAERGRAIFFGKKAACSGCHAVDRVGGRVGPDLSRIGEIRKPRDLLEAVVLPSATIARGFRSYTIATDAGRVVTGVISRETPEAITLRTSELAEVRIPRDQVEAIRESGTSIMPRGLDKILGQDELRDLIAYLQSLRQSKVSKSKTNP